MNKLSILLIEDNQTIATQLCEFFEMQNCNVDYAATGQLGIKLALENPFDVIVLDLNLPDIDGLDVCSQIKEQSEIYLPILMLTARDAFEDKQQGFGIGADDYVTKPFEFRELLLRCQALARRNQLHKSKHIQIDELQIEKNQHVATRQEHELKLTKVGFKILLCLAEAYPQAVSRSNLIHQVWGDDAPDSDALRTHIYSLRSSLDKPFSYSMLITITNVGYKLVTNSEN